MFVSLLLDYILIDFLKNGDYKLLGIRTAQ